MPRIADNITACSIYLYPTEEAARSGSSSGGSGFLVHVPSKTIPSYLHLYAVTNKHVILQDCGVLRLNRKIGGIDTIPTTYPDWVLRLKGDDVAICPLDLGETFKWWSVGTDLFITHEIIDTYRLGLGDEAFLIGRLMTHDGEQKNAPVARFGNISLMADPTELIACEDGHYQEGFLVECRSLSGFSGSPVFAMTTQTYSGADADRIGQLRARQSAEHKEIGVSEGGFKVNEVWASVTGGGPWLLGINWGHIRLPRQIVYKDNVQTEFRVDVNTGIACVLPAWRILDLINDDELLAERERKDTELAKAITHHQTSANDVV